MTNTIKTAKNYQMLKNISKTFNKTFFNYAIIPIFLGGFIASSTSFIDFYSSDIEHSLLNILYSFFNFLVLVTTFTLFLATFFMALSQAFGENRYFVTSYKSYYQNTLTENEKSLLENLLNDKFDNIIQENRKVIKRKLKYIKAIIENEILSSEYLEAFKKDIEENLKERKQYIPLLQSFAKDYHARDKDTIFMERANQYLSKAGLSTFKTKEKTNFEIIEE